jgi:hypothetical protein
VRDIVRGFTKLLAQSTLVPYFERILVSVSRATSPSMVCAALTFIFPPLKHGLVHRHAKAAVFPACRIRHIYLLCFAFLPPRQLGDMDDSDEELQLNNDGARRDSQLLVAPATRNIYVHIFRDLDGKPLAKRLKLWRFRKELLRQKLVAVMLSRSALSAASEKKAATSPPVLKQETEQKRKLEEPPFAGPSSLLQVLAKKPKSA